VDELVPQEVVAKERLPWWTSTTWPATSRKPLGWFIHAFTEMTIYDPRKLVMTMRIRLRRSMRGESQSQP
jgi:hypothetical protein